MTITLQVVNTLIQTTTRDLNSLTSHIVKKLDEDPDLIDTQWFDNKVRQKEKLQQALDELHTYKEQLIEERRR